MALHVVFFQRDDVVDAETSSPKKKRRRNPKPTEREVLPQNQGQDEVWWNFMIDQWSHSVVSVSFLYRFETCLSSLLVVSDYGKQKAKEKMLMYLHIKRLKDICLKKKFHVKLCMHVCDSVYVYSK